MHIHPSGFKGDINVLEGRDMITFIGFIHFSLESLVVMKKSERHFAIAKSVHSVEVASPSIRGMQEVEDRKCKPSGGWCTWDKTCCGRVCIIAWCL